ncbi:MAG: Trk system potassium transporter TrkA [Bacteroidota bacterium]
MRAIIVGAGDVGYDVARLLAQRRLDVAVLDTDAARIDYVRDTLDVLAIQGSGTSAAKLAEAGLHDAVLVVAVTDIDEVNIIACMMAERASSVGGKESPVTIARVRSDEFTGARSVLTLRDLGIDHLIHPEDSTSHEIVSLLRRAAATDVIDFCGGQLQLVGLKMDARTAAVGQTLESITEANAHLAFRIMGIVRGVRTILPRGDERLQVNDQVFVIVQTGQVPQVVHALGQSGRRLDNVMILGGSKVGERVARELCTVSRKQRMRVKLVEPDRARAHELAEQIEGVLVIHGDPSDIDLLAIEGLQEMDAVAAVTDDEESNLVSCLMAKHLGVRKTVALLSKSAYVPISQAIGLDAAVSQKLAVSREVLRFLRGKHVRSVATVQGLDAEILEVEASGGSPVTRKTLDALRVPRGLLVAAVVAPDGVVEVATGRTQIQPADRVIVFVTPDRIADVDKLFGRR